MVRGFRRKSKQDRSEEWVHMRIMWLFSRIVAELSGTDKPVAEKSVFGKNAPVKQAGYDRYQLLVDIRLVQTQHDFNIAQYGVFRQAGNTLDFNGCGVDVHEFTRIFVIKMKMRFVISIV